MLFLCLGLWLTTRAIDLNLDAREDCEDLELFRAAFGTVQGESAYRADADLNTDGIIDGRDLSLFIRTFPAHLGCNPLLDPDRFVPLDAYGEPIEGLYVQILPNNTLAPLEYRPMGRHPLGRTQGMNIRLPQGASIVELDGANHLSFTRATARFGEGSPIQLVQDLIKNSGDASTLPLDHDQVKISHLATAFGISTNEGLRARLHQRQLVRIYEGTLTDTGIEDADAFAELSGIPVTPRRGNRTGNIDLSNPSLIRLPLSGTLKIPDGTSNPPTLTVNPAKPVVLEVKASGEVTLQGRVGLDFPDGPKLQTEFRFDDPDYQFQFTAAGLQFSTISNIAALLPDPASICLTGINTNILETNQLINVQDCLTSFSRVYHLFSAAVAASSTGTNAPAILPVSRENTATALLDAWGYSMQVGFATVLGLDNVLDLVAQQQASAVSAPDVTALAAHHLALVRAFRGAEYNGQNTAEIAAAIAEAEAAAIQQGLNSDYGATLAGSHEAIQLLLSAESIRQASGTLPANTNFTHSIARIINRSAEHYLGEMGVVTNVFIPDDNPVIRDINRFVAFEHLLNLLEIQANAALLGVDEELEAPFVEASSQLALQFYRGITNDLGQAAQRNNYLEYQYAFTDLLELIASKAMAVFPNRPELNVIPDTGELQPFMDRMTTLLEIELARPFGERSFDNVVNEINGLLNVLDEMPDTVTVAAGPFVRAYNRMSVAITKGLGTLPFISQSPDIARLLEAGIRQHQLADQFPGDSELAAPGLTTNVLLAAVTRLIDLGVPARDWTTMQAAIDDLLAEADRLGESDRLALKYFYLQQAARLIEASHDITQALWNEENNRRIADPTLAAFDMLLPGDIHIDRLRGALAYNRETGYFGGSFGGSLRLPKYNLALTINNAALRSGGAFDINAYGQLQIPFDDPYATFRVLPRKPLHVQYDPLTGLGISGSGRIQMANGLAFEGFLTLEDPVYAFGISAEGMKFALAKSLSASLPVVNLTALQQIGDEAQRDLMLYFRDMAAAFEPLVTVATNLPSVNTNQYGTPPAWTEAPTMVLRFADFAAFANGLSTNVAAFINNPYSNIVVALTNSLDTMIQDLNTIEETLGEESDLLTDQIRRMEIEQAIARKLADEASKALLGDATDAANFLDETERLLIANRQRIMALKTPHLTNDTRRAIAVTKLLLASAVNEAVLGITITGTNVLDYGDTMLTALTLIEDAGGQFIRESGIDPATGQITDSNRFESLTIDELEIKLRSYTSLQAQAAALGSEDQNLTAAAITLLQRKIGLLEEEITATPVAGSPLRVLELQRELADTHTTAAFFSSMDNDGFLAAASNQLTIIDQHFKSPAAFEAAKTELDKRKTERERKIKLAIDYNLNSDDNAVDLGQTITTNSPGFFAELGTLFDVLGSNVPSGLDLKLNEYVRYRVQQLKSSTLSANFLQGSLENGRALARETMNLAKWAQDAMPDDTTLIGDLALTLSNITVEVTLIGDAAYAWWELSRYSALLLEASGSYATNFGATLGDALDFSIASTLVTSGAIVDRFAGILQTIELQDVVFTLPGDLTVDKVYGGMLYNRETGFLEGNFGGYFGFPDINAAFAIEEARINNDGGFYLRTSASSDLPLDGVNLALALTATGTVNQLDYVAGAGTLRVSNQTYSVSAAYNATNGTLAMATTANNIDLRLTDDFVIFGAGLGFELNTLYPSGRFIASGSAGFFARAPLPETGDLTRSNFHLTATGVTTEFSYATNGVSLALSSGLFELPDVFTPGLCEEGTPVTNGPSIALSPANRIQVTYSNAPAPSVSFAGSLAFDNIGFEVPGFTGMAVEVCSATLDFNGNTLPALSNLNGRLDLPLGAETARVALVNAAWNLQGFPQGTILLTTNVNVFDENGFTVTVLGSGPAGCTFAGFSITNDAQQNPHFRLGAGMKLTIPADTLFDESSPDGSVAGSACGSVVWTPGSLPAFALNNLTIGPANLRLGGANGFTVSNATVSVLNAQNLFNLSSNTPFIITLGGALFIENGPAFGLQNARFTFSEPGLPKFTLQGLTVGTPELGIAEGLEVEVQSASIYFNDPELPLPGLLSPANLQLGLTASLSIGVDPVTISGTLNDLRAGVDTNGNFILSVNGIGMGAGPLPLGPLILEGNVYLAGLNSANPSDWYFAGNVGGQLTGQDTRLGALLAFNADGPIGVCVDANAGAAGIPLVYGFTLNGIEGGLSFLGRSGDPCDFSTYIQLDTNGVPVTSSMPQQRATMTLAAQSPPLQAAMTWDEVAAYQRHYEQEQRARAIATSREPSIKRAIAEEPVETQSTEFPCPTGDCPPSTVGILCQPHPDTEQYPDRIIYKFTSLDESFLNDIGITASLFNGVNNADQVGDSVADLVLLGFTNIIRAPDPALITDATLFAEVNAFYTNAIAMLYDGMSNLAYNAASLAIGSSTQTVYQAILEAAYAGVDCPRLTLKLGGTFSHAAVSTFFSASVGAIISSDITGLFIDSAGMVGKVNLFGVPVGDGQFFVNYTDANGNPNPSACGDVTMALGPVEFGDAAFKYECPDCITGVLGAMGELFVCLGSATVNTIVNVVAAEHAGKSFAALESDLSDDQKLAFITEMLSGTVSGAATNVGGCFLTALGSTWNSIQPSISLCGENQLRIFGLPLGPAASSFQGYASKSNLVVNYAFSPSYMLASVLGMSFFPIAVDQASMGIGLTIPDAGELLLDGLNGSIATPEQLAARAQDAFSMFLADATYTIGYEFAPFGLKLANAEARVIMPDLSANHPVFRGTPWTTPESRGYPSRLDLVASAIGRDYLANPLWKGTASDLHLAFPEGSPQATQIQSAGLSFAQDYFPHGGIVGGARLTLPPALVDAPPDIFFTMLDPATAPLTRLAAAADYVQNYVLAFTSEVGNLVFYLPAPNPPSLINGNGELLTEQELMASIQRFDLANIQLGAAYPLSASFLRGNIDARLIGIPIVRGTIEGVPGAGSGDAYFLITAEIPANSWLSSFIDSASLTFEMRDPPPRSLEDKFTEINGIITNALATSNPAVLDDVLNSFAQDLPKVSLEAEINNFRIPDALTNMIRATSASAGLYGYSPRFQTNFVGVGPVAEVRREGGIAFRGNFTIADYITINNLELGVIPHPINLPRLLGLADIPLLTLPLGLQILNTTIQFDTEPGIGQPYFYTEGEMTPFDLGPFGGITPLTGTNLYAHLGISNSGGLPDIDLQINPARMDFGIFNPGIDILIHGATTNDPFSFNTEGPWNSTVTMVGDLVITEPLGTNQLLRINTTQNLVAQINGTGTTYAAFALQLPTGLSITAFPNTPHALNVTLDPTGGNPIRLGAATDGSFLIEAQLQAGLTVPGASLGLIGAGASVSFTHERLAITGTLSGGLLDDLDDGGGNTATGTVTFYPDGRITVTAAATLQPLEFGIFRVASTNGGPISASLDEDGLNIPTGARLEIQGVADDVLALNAFSFRTNGSFDVAVSSGDFVITNLLEATGGNMSLRRSNAGVVTFTMQGQSYIIAPDTPHATEIPTLVSNLVIASNGRFIYDSGTQNVGLPGLMTAGGRLEIGYEPDASVPGMDLSASSPLQMGHLQTGSRTSRLVTVSNPGAADLVVGVRSADPQTFPVTPSALTIPPGESRSFWVIFAPTSTGTFNNVIAFRKNTTDGPETLTVAGSCFGRPKYFQSHNAVDFGEAVAGYTSRFKMRIANFGSAPLAVTGYTVSNDKGQFSLAGSPNGTLEPGQEREVIIQFTPPAVSNYTGILRLITSPTGVHTVQLTGVGTGPRWYTQYDANAPVNDIQMLDKQRGYAVGDDGLLLETWHGGRAWAKNEVTAYNLNTLNMQTSVTGAMFHLRFEEPPESVYFEDSSHRANHFFKSDQAFPLSGGSGKFGSGIAFTTNTTSFPIGGYDAVPTNAFTVALWVNPSTTANNQTFISRPGTGEDQFLFGIYSNHYHARVRSAATVTTSQTPVTGWQHFAVTAVQSESVVIVRIYRNGVQIMVRIMSANLGDMSGSHWHVGHQSVSYSPTNTLRGSLDEVMLFDRVLSTTEIASLAQTPPRSIIAGHSGHAYESLDQGLTWKQIIDTNVTTAGGVQWNAVKRTSNQQYLLAGSYGGWAYIVRETNGNYLVAQNRFVHSGGLNDIDEYASSAIAVGENGLILQSGNYGSLWSRITNGLPSPFITGLNAIDISPSGNAVIVVGDGGTILRSTTVGFSWSVISSPTSQNLHDIKFSGTNAFIVGESGTFLKSSDNGLNWVQIGEDTFNRLIALDVAGDPGDEDLWTGSGTGYEIRHRPSGYQLQGPMAVFSDGLIDFGVLAVNESSTKQLLVSNVGNNDLVISNLFVSHGYYTVSADLPMTVPPSQSRVIKVTVQRDSKSSANASSLHVESNDPAGPFRIALRSSVLDSQWQEIGLPTDDYILDIDFPSPLVGYAVTESEVFKTTDGGFTWTNLTGLLSLTNSSVLTKVLFQNENTGYVFGGKDSAIQCSSNDCRSIVRKTTNGGASWTIQSSGFDNFFRDVDLTRDGNNWLIAAMDRRTSNPVTDGAVLISPNGAYSWANWYGIPPGVSNFDPATVDSAPPNILLTSFGKSLYHADYTDLFNTWSNAFTASGSELINDVFAFDNKHMWAVGTLGLVRYSTNGPASGNWLAPENTGIFGGDTLKAVHFATAQTGWMVGQDDLVYRSENSGRSWFVEFNAGTDAALNAIDATSASNVWIAGGRNLKGGRIWRLAPPSEATQGLLIAPDRIDVGTVPYGTNLTFTIPLQNIRGNLQVYRTAVEGGPQEDKFTFTGSVITNIANYQTKHAEVTFEATHPGENLATFVVQSDSSGGNVEIQLVAFVEDTPTVWRLNTEPEGLNLVVDGQSRTAPLAFAVVGSAASSNQLSAGASLVLTAPATQTLNGVTYVLQGWNQPWAASHTATVTRTSLSATARYIALETENLPIPASVKRSSSIKTTATAGAPAGAFIRISNATLDIPVIGGFNVEGNLYMNSERLDASLTSSGVILPGTNLINLVEVGDAEWRMNWVYGSNLSMRAQTPGLYVLEQPVTPSTEILLELDAGGRFFTSFATLDDLKLVPGVIEFGPGRISLEKDIFFELSITGSVRALYLPDETWAVNQPINVVVRDGPFSHTLTGLPNPLLDVGFLKLQNGTVKFERNNAGVFALNVTNYQVVLFNDILGTASGTAASNGRLLMQTALAAGDIELGPSAMSIRRKNFGDKFLLDLNMADGYLAMEVPSVYINSTAGGWPTNTVSTPGFAFNFDGSFDTGRIPLPVLTFDGIGISDGGNINDNYIRLRRSREGLVSLNLRDQRPYLAGDMKLALDINTAGYVSGSFYGDISFDFPELGLSDIVLASTSMGYNSTDDCQFRGTATALGFTWQAYFGSTCAGVCTHWEVCIPFTTNCSTLSACLGLGVPP